LPFHFANIVAAAAISLHPYTMLILITANTSSFSHGILFLSIAVSSTDLPVSEIVALFHASKRTIFSGFRSTSMHTVRYN